MCLYGSIHSSYHLTHEMVIMYLLPTLFVHSCRTFVWVIKYNSPQHAPVPKWHRVTERTINEVPGLQSEIIRLPNVQVVVVLLLLPQEGWCRPWNRHARTVLMGRFADPQSHQIVGLHHHPCCPQNCPRTKKRGWLCLQGRCISLANHLVKVQFHFFRKIESVWLNYFSYLSMPGREASPQEMDDGWMDYNIYLHGALT